MKFDRIVFLLFVNASYAHPESNVQINNSFVQSLFDDFYDFKLRINPDIASLHGVHKYDHLLPPSGIQAMKKVQEECQAFMSRAHVALSLGNLDQFEKHYVEILLYEARMCTEGFDTPGYYYPSINFLGNSAVSISKAFAHKDFFQLNSNQSYHIAMERLKAVPSFIKGMVEVLTEGIKTGHTYPNESLQGVHEKISALLSDESPLNSSFYAPFQDIPNEFMGSDERLKLQAKALDVIQESIMPEYTWLANFISKYYTKHLRSGPGLSNVPKGLEFYQKCLEFYTSVDGITAQEVHDIGLNEVAEIKDKVKKLANQLDFGDLPFPDLVQRVRDLESQKFQNRKQFLQYIRNLFQIHINPKLSNYFPEDYLTDEVFNMNVKPTFGGGLPVYFLGGKFNGDGRGTFIINTDIKAYRRFEIDTIAMHEGNPGHNLQNVGFNRKFDFPKFIKNAFSARYSMAPSLLPFHSAHIEGWGLYAEYLGQEMGIFNTPYKLLGYYSGNLLRASRLVVDTGIHAFGWSRDQAIDYILSNTAYSRPRAELEIDRYITWPGQATAYKIGERQILQSRKKLEETLGQEFDIKTFHRDVLACKGPMDTKLFERCLELQAKSSD